MLKKKKKPYTGRDALLQAIINGATKAGTHKDKRREKARKACRTKKIDVEE